MRSKGSNTVYGSRISTLMISMFATIASFYVAGRLWQEKEHRVYLTKELDRITAQGNSAISVDDSLKIIACKLQQKKLYALEKELVATRQEAFTSNHLSETYARPKKRLLMVIGVFTSFGHKKNRDAIRRTWMGTGAALEKMEDQKGIVARFIIGRSAKLGDSLDRGIDHENEQASDFFILENHVEVPEELPRKTKLFFAHAAENWDAEFYAKVNDDVYLNMDALGNTLTSYLDKPRLYIGCMKSGEVFSERGWTNGMNQIGRSLGMEKLTESDHISDMSFRHASGDIFVISQALAKFISINRSILRAYAHDDVSVGSWFIGLHVKHVDERKFCCSSWSPGVICSGI